MGGYKSWPDSERSQSHDPLFILTKVGLKPGMTIVDIGCGQGYFAIPAAKLVGKNGKVYGIDIDEEALGVLNEKAAKEGLKNIKTAVGEAENTMVCEACADVVFFGICLHDFQDPTKILENAKRMLKPSGLLADLDWKKLHMEQGPPYDIRFSEAKASRLIEDAGFKVRSVEAIGERFYLIISDKQ